MEADMELKKANIREFRLVPSELAQILAIGIPACITNVMQSVGKA